MSKRAMRGLGIGLLVAALLGGATLARAQSSAAAVAASAPEPSSSAAGIAVNQIGFLPTSIKRATVPDGAATSLCVVEVDSDQVVATSPLGPARMWEPAGRSVRVGDFSGVTAPGRYRLRVAGLPDSPPFTIAAGAYDALTAAALRAFYFNRSGIALTPALGGPYARAAGHPDTRILVHASAAGPKRKAGDVIAAPKGWYDAGDYNKYVVNSGITVYTLLAAYEQQPQRWRRLRVGLPESGNGLPDLLNEVLWNLEWMLSMQDPDDGGVYHKLTSPGFDGVVMPETASRASAETAPRFVVQKTTAATLDFAAAMAMGSRVFRAFEQDRPGLSARMLKASLAAWGWAQAHPHVAYRQPADIRTGEYADSVFTDEFAWAAAELYITTRDDAYLAAMQPAKLPMTLPWWREVGGLAWLSLARHRHDLTPAADQALIGRRVRGVADLLMSVRS